MKTNYIAVASMLACGLFASLANAQSTNTHNIQNNVLEAPPEPQMNRFAVSYRLGLNISADFKRLGGFTVVGQPGVNPGPATGGHTDRTYDDGYNKIDIRDNALGLTWNWGYENASQVPDPGNNVILFHSSTASATASASSKNVCDDPQHGFEFIYNRRIRDAGNGWWGIEAAFGYTAVSIGDGRPLAGAGSISILTDTYNLGGVFPPSPPPYHGDFTNAGPLISDSPSRSFQEMPVAARITGSRSLDAGVAAFRVGPYFELPASTNLSFQLSGGFALALVDSEFRFRETVTIPGFGSQTRSGHGRDDGVVPGGYVAGTVIWKLRKDLDIFANAQYQALGSYSQTVKGKRAELNLGESVFVSIGMGVSFK